MPEETTVQPEVAKPPETPTKEPIAEPKQESTPLIDLECLDGETRSLDAKSILELAKMGVAAYQKDQVVKDEPEVEPESEPTVQSLKVDLDKANENFNTYKNETKKAAELHKYKVEIESAVDNLDLVKEYPKQRNSIMREAAVLMGQTKISIAEAVSQVSNERLSFLKEVTENKNHANTKIGAIVNQVQQGTGGMPVAIPDKPMTADDVNSGQSLRDVTRYLESVTQE